VDGLDRIRLGASKVGFQGGRLIVLVLALARLCCADLNHTVYSMGLDSLNTQVPDMLQLYISALLDKVPPFLTIPLPN